MISKIATENSNSSTSTGSFKASLVQIPPHFKNRLFVQDSRAIGSHIQSLGIKMGNGQLYPLVALP